MKALKGIATGTGTVSELMRYLWQQKLGWLTPFVAVLLVVGALLLVGQASGVA